MLRKTRLYWVRSFVHTREWRWSGKITVLWVILFVGELGGLMLAFVEGSWSGGVVAFTLLVYTLLAALMGEMPLFGRTSQGRRRKVASKALGVPLSIYTHEQYEKGALDGPPFMAFNGNHIGLPKPLREITPEELSKHFVGFIYAVAPHEFTAEALHGLARRFLSSIRSEGTTPVFPASTPNKEPGDEESFYEAVSDDYRKVMTGIGPPL